jgi:hypothetical protein
MSTLPREVDGSAYKFGVRHYKKARNALIGAYVFECLGVYVRYSPISCAADLLRRKSGSHTT